MATSTGDETIVSSTTEKNDDCGGSVISEEKGGVRPGRLLINQDGTPFLAGDGVPASQRCIMMPDENGQMKMFIVPTDTPPCEENKVFMVAPPGRSSWKVKTAVGLERALTSKSNQDNANSTQTATPVEGTLSKVTYVNAVIGGSVKVSHPSKSGIASSNSQQDSALRSLLAEKPSNVSTVKITESSNPKLVTSKPSTASIMPKVVTPCAATKIVMPDGRIFTTLLPPAGSASSLKTGDILTVQHGSNGNILMRQAPSSIPVTTTVTTLSALNLRSSSSSGISVAPKMPTVVNEQPKHANGSCELTSSHTTSADADSVSNSSVMTGVKNVQISSSLDTAPVSSESSVSDVSPTEKPYPMLLFSHEAATRIGMRKTTDLLHNYATKNTTNTTNTLSNHGHIMTSGNTSNTAITSQNQNFSQIGLTSIFSSVAQNSKTTNANKSSAKPPQTPSTNKSPEVKVNTFPVLFVSHGTSTPKILLPANFVPPTSVTQTHIASSVAKSLIPSSVSVSQISNGTSLIHSSVMMPHSTIKGFVPMPSPVSVSQVAKVTMQNPSVTVSSATAKGLITIPPSGNASQMSKGANPIPYVTVSPSTTKGFTPIPATSGVSQVSRILQNTNVLIPPNILSQNSQNLSMPAYAYAKISAPRLTTAAAATPAKVQTISWPRSTQPESILKTVAVTLPILTHSATSSQVTPSVPLNTLTSVTRNMNHIVSVTNTKSEAVKGEIRIDSVFSLSQVAEETTTMRNEDKKARQCEEKNQKEDASSQTNVPSLSDGSNSYAVSKKDDGNILRIASSKRAKVMEQPKSSKSVRSPEDKLNISGKKFRLKSKRDADTLKHNSKTNIESLKNLCKPCYVVLRKFHFRQTTVSAKYAAIYRTDRCRKDCREKALRNILKRKRIVMEALHKAVTSVDKERKFISAVKSQADKHSGNSGDKEEIQDKVAGSVFFLRSTPVTNVEKVASLNNQTDVNNSNQNAKSILFSASTVMSDLAQKVQKTDIHSAASVSKTLTKLPAPRSVQAPIVVTVGSSFPNRLSSAVSSSGSLPGIPVMVRLPTTTEISRTQASLSQLRFSSPSPANVQLPVANSGSTFLPIRPTLVMNQVTSGTKVLTFTNQPTQPSQTTGSTAMLTSQPIIAKPSTTVTDLRSTISQVFTTQASSNQVTVMTSPSPGQSLMTRLPVSGVMPSTVASKSASGMQQRYYLIKVDNKNILIPANMSQQQPRAYIIPQKDSVLMPIGVQGKGSSISTTKGNITLVSVLPTGNKANQNVGPVELGGTAASGSGQGKSANSPSTTALNSSYPVVRVKSEPKTAGYGDEENTIKKNESWIKKEPVTSGYGDEGNSGLSSIALGQLQKEQVRQCSVSGMGDSSGTKRKGPEYKDDRANRVKSIRLQSGAGEADVHSEVRGSEQEKVDGSSDTASEISEHDGKKSLLTEPGLSSHEDKIRRLKQIMQEKMKALEEFKRQRHMASCDNN